MMIVEREGVTYKTHGHFSFASWFSRTSYIHEFVIKYVTNKYIF